jgi:hypothetical protein
MSQRKDEDGMEALLQRAALENATDHPQKRRPLSKVEGEG